MSTDDTKDGYEVGYGKPPKSGQFKKGQSGNRKGRPPGAKGFAASLKRELESTVTVREGNREVKMSKAEAAAKRLVASALKGDMKALAMLTKFDAELAGQVEAASADFDVQGAPQPEDYDILRNHFASKAEPDGTIDDWEIDDDGS